jgi:hypothetical protein
MRLIPFVLAAFVASTPALAQGWEEYAYPDYAFAVAFPANPQVENTTFQVAPGRSVPAQVYSVRQNNVAMKATVANLANTNLEESAVIDQAIKIMSEGGKVNANVPARIYRVYGRHLTAEWADGSHLMAQLFAYQGRLYLIEAKSLPGTGDSEFDLVRFQQSLTFTDGGTNRSEDAVRAIREACRGAVNAAGADVNPAGLDDPRCREQRPGQRPVRQ